MANPEHVEVARQGAAAIADWRRQNPGVPLDLTRADLRGAKLIGASLSGADLSTADLANADLRRADLTDALLRDANLTKAYFSDAYLLLANLRGANLAGADAGGASLGEADLSGASLINAILSTADLTEVDLTGADLRGARLFASHFFGTNLTSANLAGARLGSTSLGNCNLSQSIGLALVIHVGPSVVGVDTLIASFRGAGNRLTPDLESFFLGAGVPKELLAELPRIVGAVEYYSCFISYGQPDLDFAKRLRDDLATRGVPCWLYALDATPGERTWREIGQKRREADKMVVICSAKALVRPGALKEIEEQIDEDPDKMVPISRDNLWTEPVRRGSRDLKPFLLDRNYADFSDESCYEGSMQRLQQALRRKAE